ncbi:phage tail tip lysozyme [Treponema sp. R6D11]
METESNINPGRWEYGHTNDMRYGYGLVQWTPASKYFNWARNSNLEPSYMNSQLERILWEVENNEQFYTNTMTFKQFTRSTDTPYNLAMIFLKVYEMPRNPYQPLRGVQAAFWYSVLK